MSKAKKITYWVATLWLALGMVSTGMAQLFRAQEGPGAVKSMMTLGYPMYFLTILAIWKLLGTIAILVPTFALVKEWAYAGFFFVMTGAIASHLAVGDPIVELLPALLLLVLTIISWYFRPADKKVAVSK